MTFDYDSLIIGNKNSMLESFSEADAQTIYIDALYPVPLHIVWTCGKHEHRFKFTARLCHWFSELKRK